MKTKYIEKILILLVILAGLMLIQYIENRRPDPPFLTVAPNPEISDDRLVAVNISGEVEKPGKYAIAFGSTVYSAILRAGGITEDADVERLNLSEHIVEPCSINVPRAYEGQIVVESHIGSEKDELCNINTAGAQELAKLPGIGDKLAQAIVDYRVTEGPFETVEELNNVEGIGAKKYEAVKDKITVGGN